MCNIIYYTHPKQPPMKESEQLVIDKLENQITSKGVSNEFLVQLIALSETYLNLKTVAQYAKHESMTYRGVKNHREIIAICKKPFVIDNE